MNEKRAGNGFDDFPAKEGMLEGMTVTTIKRIIAWPIEQEMKMQKTGQTTPAPRTHTNRATLNHLLDANDTRWTLTMQTIAAAPGECPETELTT